MCQIASYIEKVRFSAFRRVTCFGISPKYLSHAPLLSIITETARERDRSERDAICNMYRKTRNGSVSVVSSNKHKTRLSLEN